MILTDGNYFANVVLCPRNQAFRWVRTLQYSLTEHIYSYLSSSLKTDSADPKFAIFRGVLPPTASCPSPTRSSIIVSIARRPRRHPTDWANPTMPPSCASSVCQAACCGFSLHVYSFAHPRCSPRQLHRSGYIAFDSSDHIYTNLTYKITVGHPWHLLCISCTWITRYSTSRFPVL
jgi:hypothetical protein